MVERSKVEYQKLVEPSSFEPAVAFAFLVAYMIVAVPSMLGVAEIMHRRVFGSGMELASQVPEVLYALSVVLRWGVAAFAVLMLAVVRWSRRRWQFWLLVGGHVSLVLLHDLR